tara:strand:- start:4076 stop:5698 length:1623 start_codon:yes stop_codon:yes gene_type:complete
MIINFIYFLSKVNLKHHLFKNKYKKIALLIIAFTQFSCSPVKETKRITIASAGKIESLDPAQANTIRSLQLISGLGDPLYRLNSNGYLEPRLAKELPKISKDGLSIDIKLRENVLFHDGTLFDSEAMAFSLRRFMKIGTQNYVIGGRIKNIETPSKYLLRIKLTRPSSSINSLLTSINLTPVSPTSYVNYKNKFLNKDFIGTGPYKLTNFQPEKQRIEPFSNYWDKKPNNKGIDYINYRNSSSLFGAIVNGDVDVLLSNSVEDGQRLSLSRMANRGTLRESLGPAMEIGYITIRSNIKPFNKKIIRQAISYSLNRKLITEKVSYGLREPLYSIIPPILKENEFSPWPYYDPILTRNLLTKSGYCNGKKLTIPLTFRSNVPADKLLALTWQEQIAKDLSDCMNIEIDGVESTTVYKQLSEGIYPSVILDWTGAYPDPEAYLSPLLSCNEIDGNNCKKGESVFSGSFWASSVLQKSLEESEKLKGRERLKELNKVESLAADGGAYIPIWLVKPRAWARLNINQPEFDGSGLVILSRLEKIFE